MSTRGIVGFALDGQLKVQYNHSDSYPSCTGERVLRFVTDWLPRLDELRTLVRSIEVIDDSDEVEPSEPGELAPLLTSCRILSAEPFAHQSFYCEWGYVVDLDGERIELYRGLNDRPATAGRWAHVLPPDAESQHWPIKLVATFPFSNLPPSLEGALPKVKTPWDDSECYAFDLERKRPVPNEDGDYAYPVDRLRPPFGSLTLYAHSRETIVVITPEFVLHRIPLKLGATLRWSSHERQWTTSWGDWHLKRVKPLPGPRGKEWRTDDSPSPKANEVVKEQVIAAVTEWANARSEAFWQWLDFIAEWNHAHSTLLQQAQSELKKAVNCRTDAETHDAKAAELRSAYERAIARLTPPEPCVIS